MKINSIRIAKYLFMTSIILGILAGIFYFSTPSRNNIVKDLEVKHLPTPIFASREELLNILTNN